MWVVGFFAFFFFAFHLPWLVLLALQAILCLFSMNFLQTAISFCLHKTQNWACFFHTQLHSINIDKNHYFPVTCCLCICSLKLWWPFLLSDCIVDSCLIYYLSLTLSLLYPLLLSRFVWSAVFFSFHFKKPTNQTPNHYYIFSKLNLISQIFLLVGSVSPHLSCLCPY